MNTFTSHSFACSKVQYTSQYQHRATDFFHLALFPSPTVMEGAPDFGDDVIITILLSPLFCLSSKRAVKRSNECVTYRTTAKRQCFISQKASFILVFRCCWVITDGYRVDTYTESLCQRDRFNDDKRFKQYLWKCYKPCSPNGHLAFCCTWSCWINWTGKGHRRVVDIDKMWETLKLWVAKITTHNHLPSECCSINMPVM